MRSVRVVEGVAHFVAEDVPRPPMRQEAVRVRIEAAFLPTYFAGLPGGNWLTPPRPFTPGQCAIGIVEEIGEVAAHLRRGQRVYCDTYIDSAGAIADHGFIGCFGLAPAAARHLGTWPNGTFAEEFVGPAQCFTPVPESITSGPELLCRLGWFATALAGFRRGGFRPGMVVAINGASGLLGTSAAVVAMAIGAAEVRLVGRRTSILSEVARLDKRLVVEASNDPTPLDFVLDCAGGDDTSATVALVERLRRFGCLALVGALTKRASLDTARLMRNSNSVVGSFWFPHAMAADVLELIDAGVIDLTPFRAECFDLDHIEDAMRRSLEHSGGLDHVALKP